MFFKSIKSTTTVYLISVIVILCSIVVFIAVQENKRISLRAVASELNFVSDYMKQELINSKSGVLKNLQQDKVFKALDRFQSIKYAALYGPNWEPQQSYLKDTFDINSLELDRFLKSIGSPYETSSVVNSTLVAVSHLGDGLPPVSYLVIVSDGADVLKANTRSLLKHTLPLLLVLLIFCCALGFSLQGKLLHPLKLLSKFAKEVEVRKDYSVELKTLDKQELVELGDSINSMLRTINSEYSKSQELSKTLKEYQKNIERLANFDRLTGFPNRQFFMETLRIELAKSMRNNQDLVVIYFEIEGVQKVYETLGQEVGDQLLIQVCHRAQSLLREGDIISRLDDAEFFILLHNRPTDTMLANIVERLITDFNIPFIVNMQELKLSTSVGIVKASDSHFNLSEIIINADIAMYHSKILGVNTHTLYLPDMMKDNKRSVLIAASIEEAIQNNEFKVNYQSKISAGEQVVGYDISVHWDSQTLGCVPEPELMFIAAQNGKTCVINEWVIETVCQDIAAIRERIHDQVVLSINLSCANIEGTNLLDYIKNTLAHHQINPENIEFKLTELDYLANYSVANEFLNSLREVGVNIALCNFGCGYSALGYLESLNFTAIRIDKQFVDNSMVSKRSTLVVKTIIKIATQLGVLVCADGVETREQAEFLEAVGCHHMQGFLFSKPVSFLQLLCDDA